MICVKQEPSLIGCCAFLSAFEEFVQQTPAQNPIPKQITEGLINPFGLVCMCVLVFHLVTNTSAFSVFCTSGIQQTLTLYIQSGIFIFAFHYFRIKRLKEPYESLRAPASFSDSFSSDFREHQVRRFK